MRKFSSVSIYWILTERYLGLLWGGGESKLTIDLECGEELNIFCSHFKIVIELAELLNS